MKKIILSPDLEKALLQALRLGLVEPSSINPEELSKKAKVIHASIAFLLKKKAQPPLKLASIVLTASALFGVAKSAVKTFIADFDEDQPGPEIKTILNAARQKSVLVHLINEAGSQLSTGDLRVTDLSRIIDGGVAGDSLKSFAERVRDTFPHPPRGAVITSLETVSKATCGLIGIWVLGGEPGLGKSTLALQIGIDVAQAGPVIYYDIDGTGDTYTIERLRQVCRGSVKLFRELTHEFYYRSSIESLESDLATARKPVLCVIDSVQTLPSSVKYAKQSLDEWIRRFKGLTQKGHTFLLVSEKARSEYGEANLSGYKGSGDIEYAGSMCAQLLANEDDDDIVEFHIVKNRHGKDRGHVVDLQRDKDKVFWFKERRAI